MCIVDHEGKFLFVNQTLVKYYGYKDEKSIIGLSFSQVYNEHLAEMEKSLSYIKSVYQNNNSVQYESFDKNHGIWFTNTLNPIRDPSTRDVIAVCVISKDITERIEKEKKLND